MFKYQFHLGMEAHRRKPGGFENGVPYEYWDIGMTRGAKDENKRWMKVLLKPTPHIVIDQNVPLRGWYKNKYEPPGIRTRPCFTEALLTQPYGGSCPVRCHFCYINNGTRGYRGQGVSIVDPSYPEKIGKQLDKMMFGWNAYISSYTEPFQELEKVYHNTEHLSEEITSRGLPLFYLTRRIPPDWALKYLMKSKYSYHQFSMITSNRDTYRKLSPGAAPLEDMFKFIKQELKPRGIYVSIQVDPVLIGIVDLPDTLQLIEELHQAGADHIILKIVEMVHSGVKEFVLRMSNLFGKEVALHFASLLTENTVGVRTIRQDIRHQWHKAVFDLCKKRGMTASLCFEFDHQTGKNLGQHWCTADQCHGFRTPIHIKNKKTGMFEPWEVCPPSGCLYCKEACPESAPCGVPFLQRAPALRPSDYLKDWWPYETK